MKSLLLGLVLVSLTSMAQAARTSSESNSEDNDQVDYLSWCEKNNVMMQNQDGQVYVRANCSEQGLKCKALESFRGFGRIMTASCEKAQ